MPLESREDYDRLNEHLWELDPVARGFSESNGYEYGPPLTSNERLVSEVADVADKGRNIAEYQF